MTLSNYELLVKQSSQLQEFEKEANSEDQYLFVLSLTDKETCLSEIGKKNSRSITAQIRVWQKEMTPEELNSKFVFINLEDTVKDFRDYVLNKYSGKKKAKWEFKFSNDDFFEDVSRLIISRIYRHKHELEKKGQKGFFSGQAHNQVQLLETKKHVRSLSHEAANRTVKYIEKKPEGARHLTAGDFEAVRRMIEELLDEKIDNCLPDNQIEERVNLRLQK